MLFTNMGAAVGENNLIQNIIRLIELLVKYSWGLFSDKNSCADIRDYWIILDLFSFDQSDF